MLKALALLLAIGAPAMSIERRLYVTDRTGISVYDIDNGHKLLRKIELPGTGDYKGIAASPQLGKLYVTSFKGDVLICLDLASDAVVWKKKYGKYADSMAITPNGQTMYLPFRDEDSWWVIDAADGAVKAKIPIGRGKNYAVDLGDTMLWGPSYFLSVAPGHFFPVADFYVDAALGTLPAFSVITPDGFEASEENPQNVAAQKSSRVSPAGA